MERTMTEAMSCGGLESITVVLKESFSLVESAVTNVGTSAMPLFAKSVALAKFVNSCVASKPQYSSPSDPFTEQ